MSIVKINIVEVATELADRALNQYVDKLNESDYNFEFPNGITIDVNDDEVKYTDEAQYVFDDFYDGYFDFIWNLKQND